MHTYKIDCIMSFYNSDQERHTLRISAPSAARIRERALLDASFSKLSTRRLAKLAKMSMAFDVPDADSLPAYIRGNNGKYFFNIEDNCTLRDISSCQSKLGALKARLGPVSRLQPRKNTQPTDQRSR